MRISAGLLSAVAVTITVAISAAASFPVFGAATRFTPVDEYRPRYHFSAARNWINDPNGLVFVDGIYHLFYQYNPLGDRWGHMSWGHARSADLVHWQELAVAIPEDPAYMIFSGSIVVDRQNSGGFGQGAAAPLVAVYTGFRRGPPEIQDQRIAYSLDQGLTWTQHAGNPVLDLGLRAFRDPKVFWHEPTQQWIMAAVLSDQRKVAFYGSPDLRRWRHLGEFGPAGFIDGAWECPDLFELPVEGGNGETRWILKVDVFKSAAAEGSGAQYFIGRFDGATFVPDPDIPARPVDYGSDFYAAASWSNLPARGGRHLWIAWMNNHEYAQDTPTAPWRGMMSAPREVSLRRSASGFELLQAPAAELAGLRAHHRRRVNLPLPDHGAIPLDASVGPAAEILVTLQAGRADEFGLEVRVGAREKTIIGYDVKSHRLFIDRSQSGRSDFNGAFAGRRSAPLALDAGSLRLHVLLDASSVEVFAGSGERALTEQVFPKATSVGLRAYANGKHATVRSLEVWDLVSTQP